MTEGWEQVPKEFPKEYYIPREKWVSYILAKEEPDNLSIYEETFRNPPPPQFQPWYILVWAYSMYSIAILERYWKRFTTFLQNLIAFVFSLF